MTTTDRRELVARAIDERLIVWTYPDLSYQLDDVPDVIDAILTALEPWLMPETPEWVQDGNWETDSNGTAVWMHGDFDIKAGGFARMAQGEGPTLAAAIRDALEGEGHD